MSRLRFYPVQPCKETRPHEPTMPRRYAATAVALPCAPTPDILLGADAQGSVHTQTILRISNGSLGRRLGDRAWSEGRSRAVGSPWRAGR